MDEGNDKICIRRKCKSVEQDEMQEDLEANLTPNHDLVQDGDDATQPLLFKEEAQPNSMPEESTNQRLASLDVYRGLTVAAMILVDYGGGLWWGINHAPWNGVTFADFVVPAFLFIVGVSLALTYKRTNNTKTAACKLVLRVLKLFGLGMLLQGGYLHAVNDLSYGVDIQQVRIMGVLQRIAIAYGIVACFEIFLSRQVPEATETFSGIIKAYRWQWVAAALLTCLYVGLLYGLYVPTWQFEAPEATSSMDVNEITANVSLLQVDCNARGSLSPGCNAVSFVDRSVMGISHLYKRQPAYRRMEACSVDSPYSGPLPEDAPAWCMAPFDPEGLLSSLPAVVTCLIGAHYGHILLRVKGHKKRIWQWSTTGAALALIGIGLDIAGIPLNKQLYTVSYMFLTGGAAALAFVVIYVLVDVYRWRLSTMVFQWMGVHALMIYALISCSVVPLALQGLYWKSPQNNLIAIILTGFGLS
eukprot:c21088_g1_i1 orf=384-1799(+)